MKERGLINDKDKVARINSSGKLVFDDSYERFLRNKEKDHYKSLFLVKFDDVFVEFDNGVFFKDESFSLSEGRLLSYRVGKNFFYFLFKSLGLHKDVYNFFEKINDNYRKESNLNGLRNKSINGHGFEGVSAENLEEVFGDFELFLRDLKRLLENYIINEKFENIFDVYVNEIKKFF